MEKLMIELFRWIITTWRAARDFCMDTYTKGRYGLICIVSAILLHTLYNLSGWAWGPSNGEVSSGWGWGPLGPLGWMVIGLLTLITWVSTIIFGCLYINGIWIKASNSLNDESE